MNTLSGIIKSISHNSLKDQTALKPLVWWSREEGIGEQMLEQKDDQMAALQGFPLPLRCFSVSQQMSTD